MSDEKFREICERYEDYRIECTEEGEIVIMPPTDPETGRRNSSIARQVGNWADDGVRGIATDSSTGCELPNGARRSPDAALSSRERFKQRGCPEFVIELLSPPDGPKRTAAKMAEWIENGAVLGWMIQPKTRTVTVFRPGREPESLTGIDEIAGEGIAGGFVLDLRPVWKAS